MSEMVVIVMGCSVRAANANASRMQLAAFSMDSLTWVERDISELRGPLTIVNITASELFILWAKLKDLESTDI